MIQIEALILDSECRYDLATILNMQGVCIRAGHHCAAPLMQRFGINGTSRASFAIYNNSNDIDALAQAIVKAQKMLI